MMLLVAFYAVVLLITTWSLSAFFTGAGFGTQAQRPARHRRS